MSSPRVAILAATTAVLCAGAVTLAFAFPGQAGCALAGFAGFESLTDGTLVGKESSEAERLAFIELRRQARARIGESFGAPRALPVVVFLRDAGAFWPLRFNDYGSSHFVGSRACVVIGPKGGNVDVVAHELMHAELFERVGYWHRFAEIPAWFDEGVAMQVDFRPRYGMPAQKQGSGATHFVRELKSYRQFFRGDDEQLTLHYAAAKAEVAHWLGDIGPRELYGRFERIRAGEGFDAAVGK